MDNENKNLINEAEKNEVNEQELTDVAGGVQPKGIYRACPRCKKTAVIRNGKLTCSCGYAFH